MRNPGSLPCKFHARSLFIVILEVFRKTNIIVFLIIRLIFANTYYYYYSKLIRCLFNEFKFLLNTEKLICHYFRCSLNEIKRSHVGIARLRHPLNFGNKCEEISFVIGIIAPKKEVL